MWTLATPFIDRPKVTEFYLEALKRIYLPRDQIDLLFVDLSKNPDVTNQLFEFLDNYGHQFKNCKIISPDLTTYVEDIDENGIPDYLSRRIAIGETMNIINSHRKGHLILWEDDIIPPPDAFVKCESIFHDEEIAAVTGVQYCRRTCWSHELLHWNYSYESVFGPGDSSGEYMWKPKHIKKDKPDGVEAIGASGTGFMLIKSDFLDGYLFDGRHTGQDVQLGRDIMLAGKKTLLHWGVKTAHLGKDLDDNFLIYRGDLCKTEVYDKDGKSH